MNENNPHDLRLEIRVSGAKVPEGRLGINELGRFLLDLQQATLRVGEILYGEKSAGGQGRKKAEIEQLCKLDFVGWKSGSAIPVVALQDSDLGNLFGHIGQSSLEALIAGIESIEEPIDGNTLPNGFDLNVAKSVNEIGKRLGFGIDSFEFTLLSSDIPRKATYNLGRREVVRRWLEITHETVGSQTVVGRLENLEGHGGRAADLFEADNTKWECHFTDDYTPQLRESWLGIVRLTGEATIEPLRRTLKVIGPIIPVENSDESDQSFWDNHTLTQLASQQGVETITDLDAWLMMLPKDSGPGNFHDELMADLKLARVQEHGV